MAPISPDRSLRRATSDEQRRAAPIAVGIVLRVPFAETDGLVHAGSRLIGRAQTGVQRAEIQEVDNHKAGGRNIHDKRQTCDGVAVAPMSVDAGRTLTSR